MKTKVYKQYAMTFTALLYCIKINNENWIDKHTDKINELDELLPSGSGFDSGSSFDIDKSRKDRLVFNTSYHHMNENGYYTGWSDHQVIITPSLHFDYDLRVTGININDIKTYIGDTFAYILDEEC